MSKIKSSMPVNIEAPLGLEPAYIWRANRRKAIVEAIARFTLANREIPATWLRELAELSAQDVDR